MTPEQLSFFLFVLVVPAVVQLVKFAAVKFGKPIPTWVLQVIAAGLSAAYVFVQGGFAGIAFPVYAGDPIAFASAAIATVLAAWGPVEVTYRIVLKRLFEAIGLV